MPPVVVVFCEEYARGSFVVQALTAAGYAVRWVRGVDTAFRLAERGPVDLLVADARSDDVLSWLVAGWRRRAHGGGRVVLLTRPGDAEAAQLGDEVVSSPLTAASVCSAAERVLREKTSA